MKTFRRWLHAFLFRREQEALDRAADALTVFKDAYDYQIARDPNVPTWNFPMAGIQIGHLKTAAEVWPLLQLVGFAPPDFWRERPVYIAEESWERCPNCGAPHCLLKGTAYPERWTCRFCKTTPC